MHRTVSGRDASYLAPPIRLRDCNVSGAGPEVQLQVTTNCLPALAFADQELSQTAKDGLARAHVLLPKPPEAPLDRIDGALHCIGAGSVQGILEGLKAN
jgi:hypothetical protein